MFLEKSSLKTVLVYRFDYGPQQDAEDLRNALELFIVRIVQEVLVHVSHQMNQAFLL